MERGVGSLIMNDVSSRKAEGKDGGKEMEGKDGGKEMESREREERDDIKFTYWTFNIFIISIF